MYNIAKKFLYLHLGIGEVPEWSIGPHSKCGERATVPGVRIPPSPQSHEARRCRAIDTFCFLYLGHKLAWGQRCRKQIR